MKLITILFCFISTIAFAQYNPDAKRDYTWVFGRGALPQNLYGGATLNFNANPPDTAVFDHDINMYADNCSMSDENGQLLFFSNGMFVADRNGNIMPHGDSINFGYQYLQDLNVNHRGYSVEQGILALKLPNSDPFYYLIHEKIDTSGSSVIWRNLYLSVVNINANNGLGDVVIKNQIIIADTFSCGRITAVRHGNGRDWWILVPENNSNAFYQLLLDPGGIHVIGKQYIGNVNTPPYGWGQAEFSPDGTLYARIQGVNSSIVTCFYQVGLYSFNRCTGFLDNYLNLSFTDSVALTIAVGLAFSPNSRYLYVIGVKTIYQFDLQSVNILASRILVATYDNYLSNYNPTAFGFSQLGPDNKIYISAWDTHYLHRINFPDSAGLNCNVVQRDVRLPIENPYISMPNNPNFRLGRWIGSPCDNLVTINEGTNIGNKMSIKVVPNPAYEILQFEFDIINNSQPMILEIYSPLSEMIDVLNIGSYQGLVKYNVSSLSNGIYFARLLKDGQIFANTKFLVEH